MAFSFNKIFVTFLTNGLTQFICLRQQMQNIGKYTTFNFLSPSWVFLVILCNAHLGDKNFSIIL